MVLAGKVNKETCSILRIDPWRKAYWSCGVDGIMIQVHKQNDELGYVGSYRYD